MLGLSGAIVFGLIAGYLSWRSAHQGEAGGGSFYRAIATFAGAIAGAAAMAVLPARSEMFTAYCLGLGVGFCLPTARQFLSSLIQALRKRSLRKRERREDRRIAATLNEIEHIERDWAAIEQIIQSRLKRPHRSLQVQELPELRVSYRAKFYAMRKFALEHTHEGVTFDAYGGLFGLPVLRHGTDGAASRRSVPVASSDESRLGDGDRPPLAQFSTTYVLGDDRYDRSFAIERRDGEFVGECGVGIWEMIGTARPRRVTAFEVWLFDKGDIRTVTGVLMSDHAFNDASLHLKATFRGDAVLVAEGTCISLSTETLYLRARITRAVYGTGDSLPNSFFEKLTAELEVWNNPRPIRGNEVATG